MTSAGMRGWVMGSQCHKSMKIGSKKVCVCFLMGTHVDDHFVRCRLQRQCHFLLLSEQTLMSKPIEDTCIRVLLPQSSPPEIDK